MEIDIRARNTRLTDKRRDQVNRHFAKIGKRVTPLARLHLELREEKNPAIADAKVAEATLHLKGTVLKAQDSSGDMGRSIEGAAQKLARQVDKYIAKRRGRRFFLQEGTA